MYYKTLATRLQCNGWTLIDEGHGNRVPHYFKYGHPKDDSRDDRFVIEMSCTANKNGSPGQILRLWQGGRLIPINRKNSVDGTLIIDFND